MDRLTVAAALIAFGFVLAPLDAGDSGVPASVPSTASLARAPVKEVTAFKDGHAFVLHEGELPTSGGNVVLDHLPAPVIGTFWPYSADPKAKLRSVTAARRKVRVPQAALSIAELLEANVGAKVLVREKDATYAATIRAVPGRPSPEPTPPPIPSFEEDARSLPSPAAAVKGSIVLLETEDGVKAVPIDRIQDVTFRTAPRETATVEESRSLLTLQLDWSGGEPSKTARIGMVYLQKGLRWIPSYKVTIDGQGSAAVRLQATILNELTDLENATVHLVVGVPRFAFEETADPMALQQAAAQLSSYFQRDARTAYAFSNAIMTQQLRMNEARVARDSEAPSGGVPLLSDEARSEDLYIFTLQRVTLRKGERMVVPVAECSLPYQDVFTLEIPVSPPPEVLQHFNGEQQAELARLFRAPKVQHKLRLNNTGPHPLTTAPALILRGERVLAQGMMIYTPRGAKSDLDTTTAVNVLARKDERETGRAPNALNWQGSSYARIDLAGTIRLTNVTGRPIEVEVTRFVLGTADKALPNGTSEQLNAMEDGRVALSTETPNWWGWYSWPWWWTHVNPMGRLRWTARLQEGQSAELGYAWHYFWR